MASFNLKDVFCLDLKLRKTITFFQFSIWGKKSKSQFESLKT